MGADTRNTGSQHKCSNCRRRRLKCDGNVPACKKCECKGLTCQGYGKPLRWIGGVASRGLLKGATFEPRYAATPTHDRRPRGDLAVLEYKPPRRGQVAKKPCNVKGPSPLVRWSPSPRLQLVDPVFAGLDYNARYLLDYFNQQICSLISVCGEAKSPYRDLMALIGSEGISNAMVAIAALHMMHGFTRAPIFLTAATQGETPEAPDFRVGHTNLAYFQTKLLEICISSKQRSLQYLRSALEEPVRRGEIQTFGTALVLALLDLFETGSGAWATHLEGAKGLLDYQESSMLEGCLEELMLFEIFGSTFAPPGIISDSATIRTFSRIQMKTPLTLKGLLCPVEILQLITTATRDHRAAREDALVLSGQRKSEANMHNLMSILTSIKTFDVLYWARNVSQATSLMRHVPHAVLAQVCQVWKLTAAIYVSRTLYNLNKDSQYLQPAVEDLIAAFEELQDGTQLKHFTWPAFIAGAASTSPEHRQWALSTLDEIWRLTLCASVKGAELVLVKLWEKQDSQRRVVGSQSEGWDWVHELSKLDRHWLFV